MGKTTLNSAKSGCFQPESWNKKAKLHPVEPQRECAHLVTLIFFILCMSLNNHESAASIDFRVTNKFQQLHKFTTIESANNRGDHACCLLLFSMNVICSQRLRKLTFIREKRIINTYIPHSLGLKHCKQIRKPESLTELLVCPRKYMLSCEDTFTLESLNCYIQ